MTLCSYLPARFGVREQSAGKVKAAVSAFDKALFTVCFARQVYTQCVRGFTVHLVAVPAICPSVYVCVR